MTSCLPQANLRGLHRWQGPSLPLIELRGQEGRMRLGKQRLQLPSTQQGFSRSISSLPPLLKTPERLPGHVGRKRGHFACTIAHQASLTHRVFVCTAFPLGWFRWSFRSQFKYYFLRKACPELPGTFLTSHPWFFCILFFVFSLSSISPVLNYTCC